MYITWRNCGGWKNILGLWFCQPYLDHRNQMLWLSWVMLIDTISESSARLVVDCSTCMCAHTHSRLWQAFCETARTASLLSLDWPHDPTVSCSMRNAYWAHLPLDKHSEPSWPLFWLPKSFHVPGVVLVLSAVFSFLTALASVLHQMDFSVWCPLQMNGLVQRPGPCKWQISSE